MIKHKALILFTLLCLLNFYVQGQDFENYRPMLSKGKMPDDFKYLGSEKYNKALEEIKKSKGSDTKNESQFALESSFAISDMMMSGRVIYGDPLSEYIQKIADLLLKDQQSLRKKLRFYIIKSTIANAYSTNEGIIFITTGLIAQVENEAQLAFIIAHEISHYNEKHTYEQFVKKTLVLANADRNSTITIEEKLRSLYRYSKSNELEADEKGMEIFLKSKYNPYAAVGLMDVLLYSYLPFDMIEWSPKFFENEMYKFPQEYYEFEIKDVSADEDEDDKSSTHPNISKRKSGIYSIIDKTESDSAGKTNYLVSRDEFYKIQKLARHEIASLYLISGNPVKAYYIAYLIDSIYGSTAYTDKIKANSIYSLCHHKNNGDNLDKFGCNANYYEGESQVLPLFLKKLKKNELSILGAKYLWELSAKYPKDKQLIKMRDQLFKEMFEKNSLSVKSFKQYKKQTDTTTTGVTKVEKIKGKKKTVKVDKYYYAAFTELLKDKKFETYFTRYARQDDSNEEGPEYDEDYVEDAKAKRKSKEKVVFEKSTDVREFILFYPDYNSVKKQGSTLVQDEVKQRSIKNYYMDEAARLGMKVMIVDPSDKENFDTDAFNSLAMLNDWLIERLNNDTLSMELYSKEFIGDISKDYGTQYLAWTGFYYAKGQLESLILLYNVENGRTKTLVYDQLNKSPNQYTIRGIIYNQIYSIKHGK